jgi:hypothetical protein
LFAELIYLLKMILSEGASRQNIIYSILLSANAASASRMGSFLLGPRPGRGQDKANKSIIRLNRRVPIVADLQHYGDM